jgi:hypothetical protein
MGNLIKLKIDYLRYWYNLNFQLIKKQRVELHLKKLRKKSFAPQNVNLLKKRI